MRDARAMTTSFQSASAQTLLDRIADVIYRSLDSALTQQCTDRHGMDVSMRRTTEGEPMEIRIQGENLFEMSVRVAIEHVGGNVYDVHCTIEDGTSCQFTYGLPEDTGPSLPPCPRLGRELAAFVLDELEKHFGRWHLRGEDD